MKNQTTWKPLFDGAYGRQNAGDDAFCAIAAWGAKKYWGAQQVNFAATRLPVMPEAVAPVIPQAILANKPLAHGYINSILTLMYRSLYLANSSGIVYAGGSTLWNLPYSRYALQQLTHLLNKPMVGIGLSIGPFRTEEDRQKVAHFLQRFSSLTLRDLASYEEAKAMALPYTPILAFDLAGLLPAVYGPVKWQGTQAKKDLSVLGVALCHFERYHPTLDINTEVAREERIKETLIRLAQRGNIKIRFFIFNPRIRGGDKELTDKVAATLKSLCPVEVSSYANEPGQLWRQVAECDAFLAVRLHAAIFAYMAGVPLAVVQYHRKCADFVEYVGLSKFYRFPSDGPPPDVAVEGIGELLAAPKFAEMSPQDALAIAKQNFTSVPWYRATEN